MPRRYSVGSALLAACLAAGGGGGGSGGARTATGFLAAPRPSTSCCQRRSAAAHTAISSSSSSSTVGPSSSTYRRRRRVPYGAGALGAVRDGAENSFGSGGGAGATSSAVVAGLKQRQRLLSPSSSSVASSPTALGAVKRPPSSEEMDAEWDAILASDDDEEDEDDDDEDDDDEASMMLSDEELLLTDATEGGDLDDEDEEEGEGEGRKKRVWYASYKERMKAEKLKEAAWQEKRKSLPKKHLEYLDEAQKNREIAAARREKYTKKFFRRKKISDIIKEKGRKAVREATWATRWPRQITRKLEDLQEGDWIEGKVRNVESYGAWVDVNAERDGLLHVRDMGETFTPTAGALVATKDVIMARVKFVDPSTGKLGLSLVEGGPREGDLPLPPPRPQISLADVSRGAELWGYVERVTNMGAYVNVGAEVPGFLLLKEIPGRPKGLAAPQVLRRNKRLRVYAKEVDREGLRIKLTCKRPRSLPRCGPVSALASDADLEEFDYDDTRGGFDDWDGEGEAGEDGEDYDEDDEDDDDDDDEGDWFYPDRGQVIPAPEVDFA